MTSNALYRLWSAPPLNEKSPALLIPEPSSLTQHSHSSQLTPTSMWRALASREFWTSSEISWVNVVNIWLERSRERVSRDNCSNGGIPEWALIQVPLTGQSLGRSITAGDVIESRRFHTAGRFIKFSAQDYNSGLDASDIACTRYSLLFIANLWCNRPTSS